MTHRIETMQSAETELSADLPAESSVEQRERMRALIGELLKTNQELRFKVMRLKQKVAQLEKGQPDEAPWMGMLI